MAKDYLHQILTRVPARYKELLEKEAAAQHRPLSNLVAKILIDHVEHAAHKPKTNGAEYTPPRVRASK